MGLYYYFILYLSVNTLQFSHPCSHVRLVKWIPKAARPVCASLISGFIGNVCSKSSTLDEISFVVDGLMAELILHSHPVIVIHICNLFEAMATNNVVPDDFGLGVIIPSVKDKTDDVANVSNYRAITLIP